MMNASQSQLPLVRLNLVSPLIDHLNRRGVSLGPVLAEQSLSETDVNNPDMFVTAPRMYQLVEALAETSRDPYFGVRVGEELDPFKWSPLALAVVESQTLGGTLVRYMESAPQDESSAVFSLNVSGGRATFHMQRFTDGGIAPRHNDGFTVAYLLSIIRQIMGRDFEGTKVVAKVCDPDVIPPSYYNIRVAQRDHMGASISFPAGWLFLSSNGAAVEGNTHQSLVSVTPETSIVLAFRQAILPHLHEFELDAARAAEICGLTKWTLSRKLQAKGTTIKKELDALRRTIAETALRKSSLPIRDVAAMVGYVNPVVFSRAFKRWTGLLPSQFRKPNLDD